MAKPYKNNSSRKAERPYELIKTTEREKPTGITPTLTVISNYRGQLRFLISEYF